jgi:hypothetical protein
LFSFAILFSFGFFFENKVRRNQSPLTQEDFWNQGTKEPTYSSNLSITIFFIRVFFKRVWREWCSIVGIGWCLPSLKGCIHGRVVGEVLLETLVPSLVTRVMLHLDDACHILRRQIFEGQVSFIWFEEWAKVFCIGPFVSPTSGCPGWWCE